MELVDMKQKRPGVRVMLAERRTAQERVLGYAIILARQFPQDWQEPHSRPSLEVEARHTAAVAVSACQLRQTPLGECGVQRRWSDSMAKGGRHRVIGSFLKAMGRAMAKARRDADLTQEQVVKRLYPQVRSVQTIFTWENGWNKATPELFERLCGLHDVSREKVLKEAYHLLASDEHEGSPVFLRGDEEQLLRLYGRCASRCHRGLAVAVLKLGLEDGGGIRAKRGQESNPPTTCRSILFAGSP